jgi:hypothetical protein
MHGTTTIVGASLLTGVVAFATIHSLNQHKSNYYVLHADDSPVTVRGGSVTLRDVSGFNCTNGLCTTTMDSSDKSVITLDRVQLDKTKPPQTFTLTPTTNWSLTLTFRKGNRRNGAEDSDHYLQICSALGCPTSGAKAVGPLYLQTDPSDNLASAWGTPDNIDASVGIPFHVINCENTPAPGDSPCQTRPRRQPLIIANAANAISV